MTSFKMIIPMSGGMARSLAGVAGVVMLAYGDACAQGRESGATARGPLATADARFDAILRRALRSGVPGIQALVTVAGKSWSGAAGVSSVEHARRMQPTDRIRVASITKMITYAMVMELAKRGELRVTDSVTRLLPSAFVDGIPHVSGMTVGQLLDHTSGLHNYNGANGEDFFARLFSDSARGTRRWTAAELVEFAKKPGNDPTGLPGQRRSYSSTGYSLLQMILEHRLGKSYAQITRELVFTPLGMQLTGVEGYDVPADSIVDAYARPSAGGNRAFVGREPVRADGLVNLSNGLQHYNAWAGAGGAVATTATDLARFMAAVREGRMIVLNDQEGEFRRARGRPNAHFSWNGGSWGIQASILYEPGRDITIIVLTNASIVGVGSHDLARELLAAARH